jgi:glycosyltransferase involved in cell wall biosynthesis
VKLISLELSQPLPAIPPCSVGEQWVLVRLHGEPLGFLTSPARGLLPAELGQSALRRFEYEITRHLVADSLPSTSHTLRDVSRIPVACPQETSPRMSVTVAVCTRNRAGQLRECLDAILALDYPGGQLDLLVVDNAPADDATRDLVAGYPRIRYVRETAPGLDRARNRAIREARGAVVAFTDDDVSVDPLWARAIAAAFEAEPHAMCVTGLVVPDELDTPAQILFERYGGFRRGFNREVFVVPHKRGVARRYGGTGRFGTGANMAFRREFFDLHGEFDPALDVGTVTNGGGDLEMFFRVLKEGHALVYEPRAIVRHRHRREYDQLRTQIENNGIGFYSYLTRSARAYPDERSDFARLGAWWGWHWNVRRFLRSLAGLERVPRDLVVAEIGGSLKGLRRYSASVRRLATGQPS